MEKKSSSIVRGIFEYCTEQACEIIREIDVVSKYEKCTKLPIVKFFSKNANKVLPAVLDFVGGVGKLITGPQEEISCQKRMENNYKNFDIIREDNIANVIFHEDNPIIDNLINIGYFNKPIQLILRDFVVILAIVIIIAGIIAQVLKFKGKSISCCLCLLAFLMNHLNNKKKKTLAEKEAGSEQKTKPVSIPMYEITDDEDESCNDYSRLNRDYHTPCAKSPAQPAFVSNRASRRLSTPMNHLPQVPLNHLPPYSYMNSMFQSTSANTPQNNQLNRLHLAPSPVTPVTGIVYDRNIPSFGLTPNPQFQPALQPIDSQTFQVPISTQIQSQQGQRGQALAERQQYVQELQNQPQIERAVFYLIPDTENEINCIIPGCNKMCKGKRGLKSHCSKSHKTYTYNLDEHRREGYANF